MPPIWKPQDNETLRSWVTAIIDEASDELNDWEIKFISSVEHRIYKNLPLSQRQEEVLERIYAEKTK